MSVGQSPTSFRHYSTSFMRSLRLILLRSATEVIELLALGLWAEWARRLIGDPLRSQDETQRAQRNTKLTKQIGSFLCSLFFLSSLCCVLSDALKTSLIHPGYGSRSCCVMG